MNADSNRTCTGSNHSQSRSLVGFPATLLGRLYAIAVCLAIECIALASIPHAVSLLGPFAPSGIFAYAIFISLGYSRLRADRTPLSFGWPPLLIHGLCFCAVSAANLLILHDLPSLLGSVPVHLFLAALLLTGIGLLCLAMVPWDAWMRTLHATGRLWLFAALAAVAAWVLRQPAQALWHMQGNLPAFWLQQAAFVAVRGVLRLLLNGLIVDPARFLIGTPHFSVIIQNECSGFEGLGLVLVFTTAWLWYTRKESRFPHALLLIPAALLTVWMLNIVRIAALVLIGNFISSEVAIVGFHSQAGWMAFTLVAFAFSMATRSIPWVRRQPSSGAATPVVSSYRSIQVVPPDVMPPDELEQTGESPATSAYLIPFLAILAAGFLSKAASGYFEWLYPIRFVAAAIALWHFRKEYRPIDWRCGWLAPVVGAIVALLWIAPRLWLGHNQDCKLGAALAHLPPAARYCWIAFRLLAAVVTVPIAEELAFRGYLARRFMDREFDGIPFRSLTLLAIALSSVAFGFMHGQLWMVGIAAGLAYAAVCRWRGRLGDAVVAHAVSNLLLAAWVLTQHDWAQW